jgi:hypothetical protein
MVSMRILIKPVGAFSSMSLKQKHGVPECSQSAILASDLSNLIRRGAFGHCG